LLRVGQSITEDGPRALAAHAEALELQLAAVERERETAYTMLHSVAVELGLYESGDVADAAAAMRNRAKDAEQRAHEMAQAWRTVRGRFPGIPFGLSADDQFAVATLDRLAAGGESA
jgi:hypothetical protein